MEKAQEPILLQSCDKILEKVENSNLSDLEKNKIKKGEMLPYTNNEIVFAIFSM